MRSMPWFPRQAGSAENATGESGGILAAAKILREPARFSYDAHTPPIRKVPAAPGWALKQPNYVGKRFVQWFLPLYDRLRDGTLFSGCL